MAERRRCFMLPFARHLSFLTLPAALLACAARARYLHTAITARFMGQSIDAALPPVLRLLHIADKQSGGLSCGGHMEWQLSIAAAALSRACASGTCARTLLSPHQQTYGVWRRTRAPSALIDNIKRQNMTVCIRGRATLPCAFTGCGALRTRRARLRHLA